MSTERSISSAGNNSTSAGRNSMSEDKCRIMYNAITGLSDELIENALDGKPAGNSVLRRRILPVAAAAILVAALVLAFVLYRGSSGKIIPVQDPSKAIVVESTDESENEKDISESGTDELMTAEESEPTVSDQTKETEDDIEEGSEKGSEKEPSTEDETAPDGLRMIRLPEMMDSSGGGQGLFQDESEAVSYSQGYPSWSDVDDLTELPVFLNRYYDPMKIGIPLGLSEEEMTQRLYAAAESLNLDIIELLSVETEEYLPADADFEIYKNVTVIDPEAEDTENGDHENNSSGESSNSSGEGRDSSGEAHFQESYDENMRAAGYVKCKVIGNVRAVMSCGQLDVRADGQVSWTISIPTGNYPDTSDHLPEGHQFTVPYGTEKEAEWAAQYYADKYSAFLGFEHPRTVIKTNKSSNGEVVRSVYVFEASEDSLSENLNFTFQNASLSINSEGNLWSISISDSLLLAEYCGDYPIISQEEATKALQEGKYIDRFYNEWETTLDDPDIVNVELVYRSSQVLDEYFMPYYRFIIKLVNPILAEQGGEAEYMLAYYVPAVRGTYLIRP